MASSALLSLLLITTTASLAALSRGAHLDPSSTASFQWPLTSATLFDNLDLDFDADTDLDIDLDLDADADTISDRRALYWRQGGGSRYYISYGALSANRIPCPPRSGRSYYTHNCFKARGPVRPYSRGCSAITRCRR